MSDYQKNQEKETSPELTKTKELPLVHPTSVDIKINKSDLILYLIDFKRSVLNRKKERVLISIANTVFILSIFFTSDFKSILGISEATIKGVYIFFASIIIYDLVSKTFKKDDSRYKTDNPDYLALTIEDNSRKTTGVLH